MKNFGSGIAATTNTIREPWGQISERDLVALTASGDGEAFAVICRRYEHMLFRAAFRVTGNVIDAEDVVQEALLKAYKNIASFGFASSLSTWLTRIVINCGLMELRRRRTRPWVPLDNADEYGIPLIAMTRDPATGIEEELCRKEQSQLLTASIARLPPKLRTIIEDYRILELTMVELAQSQAITVATAKSRLLRPRATIKKSRPIAKAMQRTPRSEAANGFGWGPLERSGGDDIDAE
jgi:RNA polymerase sigma-70 factor (ECF subfamily)